MFWLWHLLIGLGVFCLSVWIHELAHRKRASMLGYPSHIMWESVKGRFWPDLVTVWEADSCSRDDEVSIVLWGVVSGFVPIIFLVLLSGWVNLLIVVWVVFAYLWVCKSDFKRLKRLGWFNIEE